jgi:hypothetical protein
VIVPAVFHWREGSMSIYVLPTLLVVAICGFAIASLLANRFSRQRNVLKGRTESLESQRRLLETKLQVALMRKRFWRLRRHFDASLSTTD